MYLYEINSTGPVDDPVNRGHPLHYGNVLYIILREIRNRVIENRCPNEQKYGCIVY
jgi:hypothetical protein